MRGDTPEGRRIRCTSSSRGSGWLQTKQGSGGLQTLQRIQRHHHPKGRERRQNTAKADEKTRVEKTKVFKANKTENTAMKTDDDVTEDQKDEAVDRREFIEVKRKSRMQGKRTKITEVRR